MSHPLPREDSLPWYRQFWPWFLIILPGSVVVAGFVTLYIANRHSDDLVVDEYYKDGLAINEQLERKQRAAALGISARLEFDGKVVSVYTTGPVDTPNLQLLLSHPMESDRDFSVPLARLDDGTFRGSMQYPLEQRWHWTLQSGDEQGWRLDGSLDLP